jgi:hypothetical protein
MTGPSLILISQLDTLISRSALPRRTSIASDKIGHS